MYRLAHTLVDIDVSRGEIQRFFKCIKQNLSISMVLDQPINAVATLVFFALCVYLWMTCLKFVSSLDYSVRLLPSRYN